MPTLGKLALGLAVVVGGGFAAMAHNENNGRAAHLGEIYGAENISRGILLAGFNEQFETGIKAAVCAATQKQPPKYGFVILPAGAVNAAQKNALVIQIGGNGLRTGTHMEVGPEAPSLQAERDVLFAASSPFQRVQKPTC